MSTTTNTTKKTAADFAAELPLVSDGYYGPVRITSANMYNGDLIINLPVRTVKSVAKDGSVRNATKTIKSDWTIFNKFLGSQGRLVEFTILDGYVKSIEFSKPTAVSSKRSIEDVTELTQEAATSDGPKPF